MKLCFVCLHAYPLFEPAVRSGFGGSEVRAVLLARELARIGSHDVSFVVLDHGQSSVALIDGVTVVAHRHYRDASNDLSRVSHRPPSFLQRIESRCQRGTARVFRSTRINRVAVPRERVRFYRDVPADVFCVLGVSNVAAEVAAHCRETERKMVLLAGSDGDFSADFLGDRKARNSYGATAGLCRYAIEMADVIVTQTQSQARLALGRFGRRSTVIRNPIDLDSSDHVAPVGGDRVALWVGKSDDVKRPDVLLRLAIALPSVSFLAVMNRSVPEIFDAVSKAAPPNLQIIERVEFADVEGLFARAFVLINTSRFEGFPNTFLQAGKYRIPVASLDVDPDGFIVSNGCGVLASGDEAVLARSILELSVNGDLAAAYGRRLRCYVERHHRLAERARELDELVTRIGADG